MIKDSLDPHRDHKKQQPSLDDIILRTNFADGILPVPITPATPPSMLMPAIESDVCRGVILQTSGGGNVPDSLDMSYIWLIEKSRALGKTVIITSMFPYEPNEFLVYQSGIDASNAGAIQITGIVFPALVTKLSWVLGLLEKPGRAPAAKQQVEAFMKTPYVDEINPIPGFPKTLSLDFVDAATA